MRRESNGSGSVAHAFDRHVADSVAAPLPQAARAREIDEKARESGTEHGAKGKWHDPASVQCVRYFVGSALQACMRSLAGDLSRASSRIDGMPLHSNSPGRQNGQHQSENPSRENVVAASGKGSGRGGAAAAIDPD